MGTLVAVPIVLLAAQLDWLWYLLILVLLAAAGIWLCGGVARELGVHDHPGIVWDEIVGYMLTMWLAPSGWQWIVAGFVLFRLFDIWKPWPISVVDRRVEGGLGIMLDDILAGAYAWCGVQLLARIV
jgi:phosphatidylglycerophosphatase A